MLCTGFENCVSLCAVLEKKETEKKKAESLIQLPRRKMKFLAFEVLMDHSRNVCNTASHPASPSAIHARARGTAESQSPT